MPAQLDTTTVLAQLDTVLTERATAATTTFVTRAVAAINRISGPESQYSKQLANVPSLLFADPRSADRIAFGALQALRADVAAGYTTSLLELIHADLFADYLEMAQHLQDQGYKDAAAVIAGSTLESHLRQLCQKHNVQVEDPTGKPRAAETLNVELAKQTAYSKVEQQDVTAWLALRNRAAHGKYSEYTKEQVDLLLQNIRSFITRHPA